MTFMFKEVGSRLNMETMEGKCRSVFSLLPTVEEGEIWVVHME